MKIMHQKLCSNSIKNKPQEAWVMFRECQIIEDENVTRERKVDIYTVGTVLVRSSETKLHIKVYRVYTSTAFKN